MEIKSGIDIIEVSRIKKSIEELGESFINKIFTDEEIEYCKNTKKMMYQHYAARFAAKEATFKAISSLLKDKYSISWKNAQVKNDETGKPHLQLVNIDESIKEQLSCIESIDISLAHIKEYAIASVVIGIRDQNESLGSGTNDSKMNRLCLTPTVQKKERK